MNLKEMINPIVDLAISAGHAILEVYATDFDVQEKGDESPLTQADLASHRCIVAGLRALTPDIPIISEEEGLPEVFRAAGIDLPDGAERLRDIKVLGTLFEGRHYPVKVSA